MMGIHESKSSSSSSSSSFTSSFSSRDKRRRSNYTLIASSNKNSSRRNVGVSVAESTAVAKGEMKEDLATCLASISLMALTGEDAHLPKPGSSFTPSASASSAGDRSLRNPFGHMKMSWSRSSAAAASASRSSESVSSIKAVKTKLCERLKGHHHRQQQQQPPHPHRSHHQLMEDDRFLADHFSTHLQLLDCLEREEDDSSDWAAMRSWLVWCLQNNLGDIESTSDTASEEGEVAMEGKVGGGTRRREEGEEGRSGRGEERDAWTASSSRITDNVVSSLCSSGRGIPRGAGHHELRRQLALDERPRNISSSRVLRRLETSLDGAEACSSPQSSFESYGSTGTGGGT